MNRKILYLLFPVYLLAGCLDKGSTSGTIVEEYPVPVEEYLFPLQDVIEILQEKNVSFSREVNRMDGKYLYSDYWRVIQIDGITGKVLLDIHRHAPQCGNYNVSDSMHL